MQSTSTIPSNNRRRRPLLSNVVQIATAALVTYGTYQLASWAWDEWWNNDEDNENEVLRQRQQQQQTHPSTTDNKNPTPANSVKYTESLNHLQCEEDCIRYCRRKIFVEMDQYVLPKLSSLIDYQTDVSNETQQLKRIRHEKQQSIKTAAAAAVTPTSTIARDEKKICPENTLHSSFDEKSSTLWNQIKIKLMTRLITTAYIHTLIWLLYIVQEHVFVSQHYKRRHNIIHPESSSSPSPESMTRRHFNIKACLDSDNLSQLMNKISYVIERELSSWDVTSLFIQSSHGQTSSSSSSSFPSCSPSQDCSWTSTITRNEMEQQQQQERSDGLNTKNNTATGYTGNSINNSNIGCLLTREDFRLGIDAIRQVMEGRGGKNQGGNFFTSSLNQTTTSTMFYSPLQDWLLSLVLDESSSSSSPPPPPLELQQIIQSPIFESAMKQCLDVTFATLERYGWQHIFGMESPPTNKMNHPEVGGEVSSSSPTLKSCMKQQQYYTAQVPLAKILAQMKRSIQDSFYIPVESKLESQSSPFPNACIKAMNSMDIVMDLALECMNL